MEQNPLHHAFRIVELLHKQVDQQLTETEADELQRWLDGDPARRALVKKWDDPQVFQEAKDIYLSISDPETAFEARIAPFLQEEKRNVIGIHRTYWLTGMAASLLVAVLGTAFWFNYRHPSASDAPGVSVPATVPGKSGGLAGNGVRNTTKNRVSLTTADGKVIPIGDMPNGWVAEEKGMRIIKSADNTLEYVPTGQPATSGQNTLSTPKGANYKVILPDGSVAWLNAATTLKYPVNFGPHQRKVSLSGEAYFEIKDQPSAPFFVQIDSTHTEIQVLGTHFNVLAYEDDPICMTTVLEGSVKVSAGSGASGTLQKNEQASLSTDGKLRIVACPQPENAISWTQDRIILNRNITEIMRDISRWYDLPVEYQGKIKDVYLGGIIPRSNDLHSVINALEGAANGEIHLKLEKGKIIVTP